MTILIHQYEISHSATSDWWEKQSEAFKSRYLSRHPKSKFLEEPSETESPANPDTAASLEAVEEKAPAVAPKATPKKKRKKRRAKVKAKVKAKASQAIKAAATKTKEQLQEDVIAAVEEEPEVEISEEDIAILAEDIERELTEDPEANEAEKDLDLDDEDYTDPNKLERAKIAAYVLSVAAAAALIMLFPENSESIAMMATQVGKSWIEMIDEREADQERVKSHAKLNVKVPLRADEKANEETRRYDLHKVRLDSNGNFNDEVTEEAEVGELTEKPSAAKLFSEALLTRFKTAQDNKVTKNV